MGRAASAKSLRLALGLAYAAAAGIALPALARDAAAPGRLCRRRRDGTGRAATAARAVRPAAAHCGLTLSSLSPRLSTDGSLLDLAHSDGQERLMQKTWGDPEPGGDRQLRAASAISGPPTIAGARPAALPAAAAPLGARGAAGPPRQPRRPAARRQPARGRARLRAGAAPAAALAARRPRLLRDPCREGAQPAWRRPRADQVALPARYRLALGGRCTT